MWLLVDKSQNNGKRKAKRINGPFHLSTTLLKLLLMWHHDPPDINHNWTGSLPPSSLEKMYQIYHIPILKKHFRLYQNSFKYSI